MDGYVRIEGKYLMVYHPEVWNGASGYEIPLSELSSVNGLWEWLHHMYEKDWFSNRMAKEMQLICEDRFGYKLEF